MGFLEKMKGQEREGISLIVLVLSLNRLFFFIFCS